MYNYTFTDNNNKTWSRIDKRRARGLYKKGFTIVICPDNLRPFTPYYSGLDININNDLYDFTDTPRDFDKRVSDFEIYNCINCETGYHAAFYMEVKKND